MSKRAAEESPLRKRASADTPSLDSATAQRCVNNVRVLAAEIVQKAKSGHPGAPMGCAPIAHTLFGATMTHAPSDPKWINRDRFVLSNGHACALLYTMLHLSGFDVPMSELQRFRQLNSITPGHPEVGVTPGVEVTTGPLGQGISNAVGLAIARHHLAARFNRPGFELFNNYTYCLVGDGCLQEGVASEAASLAGHLGLGSLIVLWDDNRIQIDGETELAFTEDVMKRFEAYGFQTLSVENGDDDLVGIAAALAAARAETARPSFIRVHTTIGFGSSKAGTEKVHGAPLGDDDLRAVKERFGFDPATSFVVLDDVRAVYAARAKHGEAARTAWLALFEQYKAAHPALGAELARRIAGELPANFEAALPTFADGAALATRQTSQKVIEAIAESLPEFIGGSADLTGSNLTRWSTAVDYQKTSEAGRYLRFGVREHAMGAICNGLLAYGALRSFGATFLNFIEYAFPAVRLSALSHFGVIYVMTHDSIGLGEDGPTHQPVEALAMCRATPNVHTWRPADGVETSAAYLSAFRSAHTPSVLALTRQPVPRLAQATLERALHGAYVVQAEQSGAAPSVVLIGTGSEVAVCLDAAKAYGAGARVVSAPCLELFAAQPQAYIDEILPPGVPVLAVEAAASFGWQRWAHGVVGLDRFGASAPIKDVYEFFGFTGANVAARAQALVAHFAGKPAPPTHIAF